MSVRGRGATFDEHRGLGEVEVDDDARRYRFHCTAIADGTRTVVVGAAVEFRVVAGPIGTVEASGIRTPAVRPPRTPGAAG